MAFAVDHIQCASCGGTLAIPHGNRTTHCPSCNTRNLMTDSAITPRQLIEPGMSKEEALARVKSMLRNPQAPPNLAEEAEIDEPELCFIPFIEYSAKEVGLAVAKRGVKRVRKGRVVQVDGRPRYYDPEGNEIEAHEYYKLHEVPDLDTMVKFNDLYESGPACHLPEWGLENVNLKELRQRKDFPGLLPYNPLKDYDSGDIYEATRDPETFVRQRLDDRDRLSQATDYSRETVDLVEEQKQLIYVPVWSVRYSYGNRLYHTTVCATSRKILQGRAPQKSSTGILFFILVSSILALPIARIARILATDLGLAAESVTPAMILLSHPVTWVIALTVGAIGLTVVCFLLSVAWTEFRYRGELLFSGETASVVKLQAPNENVFDKLANKIAWVLKTASESAFEEMQKKGSTWGGGFR